MRVSLTNSKYISKFLNQEWKHFFKQHGIERRTKHYYFKAIEKGEIIGAAVVKIKNDIAKLDDILIKKEYQREGIGSKLLLSIENKARQEGCKKLILETSKLHREAIHFYVNNEYKILAELPQLYYNTDWYILGKNL